MSDLLDSMTTGELIALFSVGAVIIGAAVGAGGAIVATVFSERAAETRQRELLEREDRLHRERLAREDRHRFIAEKRELYARFIASSTRVIYGHSQELVDSELLDAVYSMAAIRLIGAAKTVNAANPVLDFVKRFIPIHMVPKEEEQKELMQAMNSFVEAAREELSL